MQTFPTPFSRAYWKTAALELKNTRLMVLAALIVAIRVAVKSIYIPVGENLNIMIGFLPNALGSLIYGPVVALLTGAISDILGVLLFPKGAFFPPFTLVEMLGSFLFALFLYRAPLRFFRIALSKFSVNLFCNMLLTPIFLGWMNGKAATVLSLPRIAKNVLLFPFEAFLLTLFLGAMVPVLKRMNIMAKGQTAVRVSARQFIFLSVLFLVSLLCILLYYRVFLA